MATGPWTCRADAPIHGRYSGVDAAGPLWAMEFVSDNEAPIAFVAPCDGLDYEFEARSNGVSTSQRVLRRWMSAGVSTPITPTTVPWSADLVSGGTAQGNAQAQAAAWAGRLAFLAKHLGQ